MILDSDCCSCIVTIQSQQIQPRKAEGVVHIVGQHERRHQGRDNAMHFVLSLSLCLRLHCAEATKHKRNQFLLLKCRIKNGDMFAVSFTFLVKKKGKWEKTLATGGIPTHSLVTSCEGCGHRLHWLQVAFFFFFFPSHSFLFSFNKNSKFIVIAILYN